MNRGVALITGATSGIGAAVGRRFARLGYALILSGRREDRLNALASELDVPVHSLSLDVTDRDAVLLSLGDLPERFSTIDVLVHSAGLASGADPVADGKFDDWDRMVDTNVKGLLTVTRAVLPGMIARRKGHVVVLGSAAGSYPAVGPVYGGTKAFANLFSLALRREVMGSGIRITSIEPGRVDTEFSAVRFGGSAQKIAADQVEGSFLSADDIAATIEHCITLPAHVNVNRLEVMAINQSPGPFAYAKRLASV